LDFIGPPASGNYQNGRQGVAIDRIVIHTMDGYWSGADARFKTSGAQVSAHYGVCLDGSAKQWVNDQDTAYHAGDFNMNLRSIGIEHEDGGDYNGTRTPELYTSSSQLVANLCSTYKIPCNRSYIRKHSEVSTEPGGTACPDALDIDCIIAGAVAILNPQPLPIQEDIEDFMNDGIVAAGTVEFFPVAVDTADFTTQWNVGAGTANPGNTQPDCNVVVFAYDLSGKVLGTKSGVVHGNIPNQNGPSEFYGDLPGLNVPINTPIQLGFWNKGTVPVKYVIHREKR